MDVGLTKMSTKGQLVIPQELRKEFKIGEKLLVIKSEGKLVIKKASELDKQLIEDLELARKTEEAWKSYEKGEFKSMETEDFLKYLKNGTRRI